MTNCRILTVLATMGWAMSITSAQTWSDPEPVCAQASNVFCTGFEEGSFSIWDDYDGNPAPWNLLQSAPWLAGQLPNTVARLRVPEGRGVTDLVKVLPSTANRVYARWYQQWEPGFDFSAPNHGSGIHGGDRNLLGVSNYRPSGSDRFSAYMDPINSRLSLYVYYRGMYQDCADPNGSCFGDHFPCFLDEGSGYCTNPAHRERLLPPLLETGRWYCLEMMLDAGDPVSAQSAANGQLNMWIDGVEYGPWQQLWFRTTALLQPSILWLQLFHHEAHSVEGVLLDNVVVSRSRIGCAASPVAVPKAPTDVRVN